MNPPAFGLALAPATNTQKIRDAALTAVGAILKPLLGNPITSQIIGPILLFGGLGVLILAVVIIKVVDQVQRAISGLVGSLPALPLLRTTSATTTKVEATVTPTLMSDPQVSDLAPATLTVEEEAVSSPVTSIDPSTPTKRLRSTTAESAKDLTEAVEVEEVPKGLTTLNAPESSADVPKSGPVKPGVQPATPRLAVRDSLKVGKPTHPSVDGHPTGGTGAAGGGAAAESSAAGSSPTASSPNSSESRSGASSGGDDAGDS